MNSTYWMWFIIVFCIILPQIRTRNSVAAHLHIRKKRRRKELNVMNKIVTGYVGKECIIYTIGGSSVITGVVESVEDGWMIVRRFDSQETEAVNVEYITRIQEYPKNKKGKRKMIWA